MREQQQDQWQGREFQVLGLCRSSPRRTARWSVREDLANGARPTQLASVRVLPRGEDS